MRVTIADTHRDNLTGQYYTILEILENGIQIQELTIKENKRWVNYEEFWEMFKIVQSATGVD